MLVREETLLSFILNRVCISPHGIHTQARHSASAPQEQGWRVRLFSRFYILNALLVFNII